MNLVRLASASFIIGRSPLFVFHLPLASAVGNRQVHKRLQLSRIGLSSFAGATAFGRLMRSDETAKVGA